MMKIYANSASKSAILNRTQGLYNKNCIRKLGYIGSDYMRAIAPIH